MSIFGGITVSYEYYRLYNSLFLMGIYQIVIINYFLRYPIDLSCAFWILIVIMLNYLYMLYIHTLKNFITQD